MPFRLHRHRPAVLLEFPPNDPICSPTHSPLTACSAGDAPKLTRRSACASAPGTSAPRVRHRGRDRCRMQAMQVDVIAVQEVDGRTQRTGFIDQAAALATALGLTTLCRHHRMGRRGLRPCRALSMAAERKSEGTGWTPPERVNLASSSRSRSAPMGGRCAYASITLMGVWCRGTPGSRSCERSCRLTWGTRAGAWRLQRTSRRFRRAQLIEAGLVDLGAERNVNTAERRIDYILADDPLARLTMRFALAHRQE